MPNKEKEDDRPIVILGAREPARTASFYRALGIPCPPHRPGVTKHFVLDLGKVVAHIVPSRDPNRYKGVALGVLVPLLQLVVMRLCSTGHIADAEELQVRATEEGRHATLPDPDGRLILLVESHKVLPPPDRKIFH